MILDPELAVIRAVINCFNPPSFADSVPKPMFAMLMIQVARIICDLRRYPVRLMRD